MPNDTAPETVRRTDTLPCPAQPVRPRSPVGHPAPPPVMPRLRGVYRLRRVIRVRGAS
jgi:hypothetical protein